MAQGLAGIAGLLRGLHLRQTGRAAQASPQTEEDGENALQRLSDQRMQLYIQ